MKYLTLSLVLAAIPTIATAGEAPDPDRIVVTGEGLSLPPGTPDRVEDDTNQRARQTLDLDVRISEPASEGDGLTKHCFTGGRIWLGVRPDDQHPAMLGGRPPRLRRGS